MEKAHQLQPEVEHQRQLFARIIDKFENDQMFFMPESSRNIGLEPERDFFPDSVTIHYPFPLDFHRRLGLAHSYHTVGEQLQQVDPKHLLPYEQHMQRLVEYQTGSLLRLAQTHSYLRPVDHTIYSRPWSFLQDAQMMGVMEFESKDDYALFAQYMARWPEWVDMAIKNMREGMATGYVQPGCVIDQTLQRLRLLLKSGRDKNPFLIPVHHMPVDFSLAVQHDFRQEYSKLTEMSVMPAYERLYEFMLKYFHATLEDEGPGMYHLPNGREEYQTIAEYYTQPGIDLAALHKEAQARVDEVLSQLAPQARNSQDVNECMLMLYDQLNRQGFATGDEALAYYRELDEQIRGTLPQHFAEVPPFPLLVSIPEDHTASVSTAHYRVSGKGAARAGRMILPVVNTNRYSQPSLARLLRHEGWPGHHMIHSMYRLKLLPVTPMMLPSVAFEEGWATYAETLDMHDGILKDDKQYKQMRLITELSIARGVVLETGIHALGWSLEQAFAYRRAHGGADAPEVERDDILRFVAWPGQCLTYYEGEKHFVEARRLAQGVLRDEFDAREFHTFMLSDGPMPLSLSDQRLKQWLIEKLEAGTRGA